MFRKRVGCARYRLSTGNFSVIDEYVKEKVKCRAEEKGFIRWNILILVSTAVLFVFSLLTGICYCRIRGRGIQQEINPTMDQNDVHRSQQQGIHQQFNVSAYELACIPEDQTPVQPEHKEGDQHREQ